MQQPKYQKNRADDGAMVKIYGILPLGSKIDEGNAKDALCFAINVLVEE
jgi:hypothetical protein